MLDLCKRFFDDLNARSVPYCHWKSNVRLDRSLEGRTDLDLLVHPEHRSVFEEVLDRHGLKQVLSPRDRQYPGLEDYLGFDESTGRLIHLHVHYRLILGQRYIKNHHLPIEGLVFQHLIKSQNVYVPCPEMELLLLTIRAHMKIGAVVLMKHGIKDLFSSGYTAFPSDIESELKVLIRKSDMEKLDVLLSKSGWPLPGVLFRDFFKRFSAGNLRFYHLIQTRRKILSALKPFRRQTGVRVYLNYLSALLKEFFVAAHILKPAKKRFLEGGRIFSIVGADGSGKSTLIHDLKQWLEWKVSVETYYYGIPKANVIRVLDYAMRGLQKIRLHLFSRWIQSALWVRIANRRFRTYTLSKTAADQGKIVLTDRFPVKDFEHMREPMDGPRLSRETRGLGAFLAGREKEYYDRITPPDCLFVLQAAFEELRKRKSDLDVATHREKADAVNAMQEDAHRVFIDANQSYEDVQLSIKRKIWQLL